MRALTFCGFALVLAAAILADDPTPAQCPFSVDETANKFVTAKPLSDFSQQLYKKIVEANPQGNVVYSPISIALALALVESGASGQTRTELKKILAPTGHTGEVSALYQALQHQLRIKEDNAKLNVANSLFYDNSITLKPDYLTKAQKCFETEIARVDFRGETEAARRRINTWISNATNEKIPELIKPGVLSRDTRAVLANAIYFKAGWSERSFDTADLKFNPFGRTSEQLTTKFMTRVGRFSYSANEFVEMAGIRYDKVPITMYVVKAKSGAIDSTIESKFTTEFFSQLATSATSRRLFVKWPMFTIRLPTKLTTILAQVGVAHMFTNGADFSRMDAANSIKVDNVIHEAFIKVNENGTEAAAATAVVMGIKKSGGNLPRLEEPLPFIVDNPFMFSIIHNPTGAILFHGKVNTIKNDVQ